MELPRVTAKEIIAVLERLSFSLSRQSGSHKIYKNQQGRRVTIPFYGSKILHPKILKSIMRDTDVSLERLIELLHE
ncbi:type II toxin-antitoxin system HicA family toxin [Candidatus Uhrbacteria bacterium]|nr:type II toxin-antitoxin system HicA family toxin [Candidatus Uhrbacteria bacterium]